MRVFESHAALEAALALDPLEPGAYRFAKQFGAAGFVCHRCKQTQAFPLKGGGTGYCISSPRMVERGHCERADEMVCYECCGETDRADMVKDGKAVLYLTHEPFGNSKVAQYDHWRDGHVSNWTGTLKLAARVKRGRHNIVGLRARMANPGMVSNTARTHKSATVGA